LSARGVSATHQGFWLRPPGIGTVVTSLLELFGYDDSLAPWSLLIAINVAMVGFSVLGILKALRVAPHAALATILIMGAPIAISVLVSAGRLIRPACTRSLRSMRRMRQHWRDTRLKTRRLDRIPPLLRV
jgi:hypothetical protein